MKTLSHIEPQAHLKVFLCQVLTFWRVTRRLTLLDAVEQPGNKKMEKTYSKVFLYRLYLCSVCVCK